MRLLIKNLSRKEVYQINDLLDIILFNKEVYHGSFILYDIDKILVIYFFIK